MLPQEWRFRVLGFGFRDITPIMEKQMEKKIENDTQT